MQAIQHIDIVEQPLVVGKQARASLNNQRPCVLWLTGLSGSGKSSTANLVAAQLHAAGHRTYMLDGDNLRYGLNSDLGFDAKDRIENVRRVAEVSKLMVDAGLIVLVCLISPFCASRENARKLFDEGEFIEVFVDAPLMVAERRDPKGLYKKARQGKIPDFTGIDSPYEAPESPEIHIETSKLNVDASAALVIEFLRSRKYIRS
jgi:bifunctional enzyme CysN/CysC